MARAKKSTGCSGDVFIVREDAGASSWHQGGRMYTWHAVRGGKLVPHSGFYDSPTGYARKGGSGKGAAVAAALKELGFNRVSDAKMKDLLRFYPHDSDLRIEEGNGAFHAVGRSGVVVTKTNPRSQKRTSTMAKRKTHRKKNSIRIVNRRKRNGLAIRTNRRRNSGRRANTHLKVGSAVSFKGHGAKVVKAHAGDKYTIRFPATGSKKVVSGSSLRRSNGLRIVNRKRKKNPYLSFMRHGDKAQPVTFFAHSTRQKKAQTGTGTYRRKGKTLKGRKMGWRSSKAMAGHSLLGRSPASKVLTKVQQNAKLRAAWRALPKAKQKAILARLRAGKRRK